MLGENTVAVGCGTCSCRDVVGLAPGLPPLPAAPPTEARRHGVVVGCDTCSCIPSVGHEIGPTDLYSNHKQSLKKTLARVQLEVFVMSEGAPVEGAGQLQARQHPCNCKRHTQPQLHVPQHGCNWTFVLSEGAAGEWAGQLLVRH